MPKSDKSAATDAMEDAINAATVVFSLNPVYVPEGTPMWQAQTEFFKETEKFTAAWLKRRQEATQSTIEMASQFASHGLQAPDVAMKAVTDWQSEWMERLAEDAKDYTEMLAHCVAGLSARTSTPPASANDTSAVKKVASKE